MSAEDVKDQAKRLYGWMGWFVDHPEIGPVILEAAEGGWDISRLQGALAKKDWWKKTAESARKWDVLKISDPATAERRVDESALSIALEAGQLGIRIGTTRLADLAENAIKFGWNESEVKLAIAAEMKYDPRASHQGDTGSLINQVKAIAADYMVPVTDKQAWQWARRIVAGGATMDSVIAQFTQLAKARFPQLKDEIDQGLSPGQFFTPYRNVIGNILEMPAESIDLMDQRWSPITSFRSDKKGELRPMVMNEAERYARMQPEWSKTNNAWQTITTNGAAIIDMFGGMG